MNNKSETPKTLSKVDKTLEVYYIFTAEASKIARQLAIMEGAIFWAIYFLISSIYQPRALMIAFYLILIIFFILDLTQYVYGASKYEAEVQRMKKINTLNPETPIKYEIGDEIGKNIKVFYILKLIFLGISTLLLMILCSVFFIMK
jgi:Ca2+/Na+ antiporter